MSSMDACTLEFFIEDTFSNPNDKIVSAIAEILEPVREDIENRMWDNRDLETGGDKYSWRELRAILWETYINPGVKAKIDEILSKQ